MSSSKTHLYSPAIDFFFVGGFSLVILGLLFCFGDFGLADSLLKVSPLLLWIGNWPHFSSTLQRLYGTKETSQSYPITYYVLPIVILIMVFISFKDEIFARAFVKVYMLWAGYHYSGQTFGICLLYALRHGKKFNNLEKNVLKSLIYASFFVLIARGESQLGTAMILSVPYASLGVPVALKYLSFAFFSVTLIVFIKIYYSMKLPFLFYLPIIVQILWFVPYPLPRAYDELIPFFHSIQYLPFVFYPIWLKSNKNLLIESLVFMRKNFVGGAFLFWLVPIVMTLMYPNYSFAKVVIYAAINTHHFWVDGIIWKLRDSKVLSPFVHPVTNTSLQYA